jgi:hypothetical protein
MPAVNTAVTRSHTKKGLPEQKLKHKQSVGRPLRNHAQSESFQSQHGIRRGREDNNTKLMFQTAKERKFIFCEHSKAYSSSSEFDSEIHLFIPLRINS